MQRRLELAVNAVAGEASWTGVATVRDVTEHVVFATRGNPPVPPAALRPNSLFHERRSTRHSEKPPDLPVNTEHTVTPDILPDSEWDGGAPPCVDTLDRGRALLTLITHQHLVS